MSGLSLCLLLAPWAPRATRHPPLVQPPSRPVDRPAGQPRTSTRAPRLPPRPCFCVLWGAIHPGGTSLVRPAAARPLLAPICGMLIQEDAQSNTRPREPTARRNCTTRLSRAVPDSSRRPRSAGTGEPAAEPPPSSSTRDPTRSNRLPAYIDCETTLPAVAVCDEQQPSQQQRETWYTVCRTLTTVVALNTGGPVMHRRAWAALPHQSRVPRLHAIRHLPHLSIPYQCAPRPSKDRHSRVRPTPHTCAPLVPPPRHTPRTGRGWVAGVTDLSTTATATVVA